VNWWSYIILIRGVWFSFETQCIYVSGMCLCSLLKLYLICNCCNFWLKLKSLSRGLFFYSAPSRYIVNTNDFVMCFQCVKLIRLDAVHCKCRPVTCEFGCLNSTVNVASCLLGSAQTNMSSVKSKLLQSVNVLSILFFIPLLFHHVIYVTVYSIYCCITRSQCCKCDNSTQWEVG